MERQVYFSQKGGIIDKPELNNLKLLLVINFFLLITSYLMPQYFGIDVGFDITCTRAANIILILYAFLHTDIFNAFSNVVVKCSVSIPLFIYLLVAFYTMVLRVDINAFVNVFLEVLTFYMLLFGIRYVIGIRKSLKVIIFCAYFLTIYGFVEFLAGQSLYLKFLRTVSASVANVYRSGYYRIMGPCSHPLGYGLLMLLLVPIACLDYDIDEIDVYKRPLLLVMIVANVFLTGSRSSEALILIELIALIIFSKREKRQKALLYTLFLIIGLIFFVGVSFKTKIGNYILLQVTILIDEVLDTTLSLNFGAELSRLNDSESYREFLPLIFKLDWLNPFLGRGVKHPFSAEMVNSEGEVAFIKSIDSFYVSQYVKYAYPGLISYVIFIAVAVFSMAKKVIREKSGTMLALLIGVIVYFVNLYWVDALQTLKFLYIMLALFFALSYLIDEKQETYY